MVNLKRHGLRICDPIIQCCHLWVHDSWRAWSPCFYWGLPTSNEVAVRKTASSLHRPKTLSYELLPNILNATIVRSSASISVRMLANATRDIRPRTAYEFHAQMWNLVTQMGLPSWSKSFSNLLIYGGVKISNSHKAENHEEVDYIIPGIATAGTAYWAIWAANC